jgi:hypothetical protein
MDYVDSRQAFHESIAALHTEYLEKLARSFTRMQAREGDARRMEGNVQKELDSDRPQQLIRKSRKQDADTCVVRNASSSLSHVRGIILQRVISPNFGLLSFLA